ncbi:hypothetical protein Tco_0152795 [Tanacetum coccineum]
MAEESTITVVDLLQLVPKLITKYGRMFSKEQVGSTLSEDEDAEISSKQGRNLQEEGLDEMVSNMMKDKSEGDIDLPPINDPCPQVFPAHNAALDDGCLVDVEELPSKLRTIGTSDRLSQPFNCHGPLFLPVPQQMEVSRPDEVPSNTERLMMVPLGLALDRSKSELLSNLQSNNLAVLYVIGMRYSYPSLAYPEQLR